MIGWALFAGAIVASLAFFYWYRRRIEDEQERLRESQKAALHEAKADSDARIGRLQREAVRERGSKRDALVVDLLPALDSLRIARDQVVDDEVRQGLDMALRDIRRSLARHDVTEIFPEEGESFDPALHEAVETVDDPVLDDGTVATCHRAGWSTGTRVLRPAMVSVVRQPETAERPELDEPDDVIDDVSEPQVVAVGNAPGRSGRSTND